MANSHNWVQSGNFTPNYNGNKKEVEFINNGSSDFLKKIVFAEKTGFWGDKSYSFVITLNCNDINYWIDKAPSFITVLNNYGGKAAFSYMTSGQISIELDSVAAVPTMLGKINSLFASNSLPKFVTDSICDYATPQKLSIFDHAYKGNIPEIEALLRSGKKVKDKDSQGQDLLHIGYLRHNKKLCETALKWGASIDDKDLNNKSILTLSVEAGDYDWYKFATNKFASKTIKDANLDNLLHIALKSYKGLLEMNKKAIGSYSLEGSGLKEKGQDYKLIIKDLSKRHELVKQQNKQGETPMSIASEIRGDKSVFDGLVHEVKYDIGIADVLAQTIWAGAAWADVM